MTPDPILQAIECISGPAAYNESAEICVGFLPATRTIPKSFICWAHPI